MAESGADQRGGGIYAEVKVIGEDVCPIVSEIDRSDVEVTNINRVTDQDGTVIEEFTAPSHFSMDGDVKPVLEHDHGTVYRFNREYGGDCACDQLTDLGCPVAETRIRNNAVHLSFYAPDRNEVSSIISSLRKKFGNISLQYLCRDGDGAASELVIVDSARLTDRQREVLQTAYREGYFEYPRESNATEVAEKLDISLSTFMTHLVSAQSKILSELLS